jgi:hypothetical protein
MNSQPTPYEVKRGKLVDAVGRPVNFKNIENIKAIAQATNDSIQMVMLEEEIEELQSNAETKEECGSRELDEIKTQLREVQKIVNDILD